MNQLEFNNVGVVLGEQQILSDVSFDVPYGEFVALLGPNGVGKTTLMKAAAGLISYQGNILINGHEVREISSGELGKSISYIPQGHEVHWPMSVRDIVALGRLPFKPAAYLKGEQDEQVIHDAMTATEVNEFADRPYSQLSGGEKSRVMIARALANGSNLMLADEPTAALDPYHQLQILEMLRNRVEGGLSVIVILHDIMLAGQFADRIILMHDRNIIADGKPEETLRPELLEEVYGIKPSQNLVYKRGIWKRVQV